MFDSEYRAGTVYSNGVIDYQSFLSLSLPPLASEALQFAFSHCHKSCRHNKK